MSLIDIDGYTPKHLSYSTVSGYRDCGERFRLQKVLRVEQKPGLAAIGGNAVHCATEAIDLAEFLGVSVGEALDIINGEGSH